MCSVAGQVGIETVSRLLLTGAAKICLRVLPVLDVARLVGLFVESLTLDMRLTSDKNVLRGRDTARIQAEVTFAGLQKFCGGLGNLALTRTVVARVVTRLTKVLLKRSLKLAFVHGILKKDSLEGFIQEVFEEAVGSVLTLTGLDKGFEAAARAFCHWVWSPTRRTSTA